MIESTDLEICKRIAEIDGIHVSNVEADMYNPLTDDALCFRLMVKYKIDFCNYINDVYAGVSFGNEFQNRSPNHAICLAIIAANEAE